MHRYADAPWLAGVVLAVVAACNSDSGPPPPSSSSATLFLNVLPPGNNGNSAGGVGTPGQPATTYPPHFEDQLALYDDLGRAPPSLRATPCNPPEDATSHQASSDLVCNYFKNEGLVPDTVTSTETLTAPSGGRVTIRRDGWGVPFVSGATRGDAMYGFGYASAEDRLWLFDLLRSLGRGRLSEFLGPANAFYSFDSNYALVSGYDEEELAQMVERTPGKFGPLGAVVVQDIDNDLAGINAYIDSLSGPNAGQVPPEYATLKGGGFPPAHFTRNDILASAILIQSTFAVGGGAEHLNELLLQELDPTFGPGAGAVASPGCELWRDLRHADDPDATRTIDAAFQQSPAKLDESCPQSLPAGAAVWDVGSFRSFSPFSASGAAGMSSRGRSVPAAINPIEGVRAGLRASGLGIPDHWSNFIAVTANETAEGHPIAVMGPQTSYSVPELLWEVAMHSDGGTPLDFDGRGIVFANLPYIEIGRGYSYAWSATSGDSDLIDVRVSRMCNLDGSTPSRDDANGDGFPDATGYLFDVGDGQGPSCRRFFERNDQWAAQPTLASLGSGGPLSPETIARHILRTHYGPVFATATVAGVPVAVSLQRSSFRAELDGSVPFALASTRVVHDAKSFQQLFSGCTGSFNWLYVDGKDVGYLHSGLYPLRDPAQSPDLPVWGDGRFEWMSDRGLTSSFFVSYGGTVPYPDRVTPTFVGDPLKGYVEWQNFMPLAQHPQAVNPSKGWITSWNNSPATRWWAADARGNFGPAHRVDALASRLAAFQATGKKFDVGNMVEIMADAAFTDLRGQEVLPLLLGMIRNGPMSPSQSEAATMMQDWLDAGSNNWVTGQPGLGAWRRDRDGDGVYEHRAQIVLMDAWYPHLIDALLPQVTAIDGSGGTAPANPTQCNGLALQCRYDAPRAQGSAYEYGYYELMKRVLQMSLGIAGRTGYRALKCAGTGDPTDCRNAVLTALDQGLADLGGIGNSANWDGATLVNAQNSKNGSTVETYDQIAYTGFSLLGVPTMRWTNRPTFQQVVQVRQ